MQRYFVKGIVSETTHSLEFSKEQIHQLKKVMRMKVEEQFEVVDENSTLAIVELVCLEPFEVRVIKTLNQKVELPVFTAIAVGLSKGDKLDWIVQKATELGVNEIIPIEMSRNVVKWNKDKASKKTERLQKIAEEASEQSHRLKVPFISDVMTIEEAAKEGERVQLVKSLQALKEGEKIVFVFGPEGGIDEKEVAKLQMNEFHTCSLGPRILRAETAPLYALSALSYQCELLQ